MTDIKNKFKVLPAHAVIMIVASLLSLVSMFIPMFDLNVMYRSRRVYSLFTMLLHPRYHVQLQRSGFVDLDFQMFGVTVFIITIIVSVAALTLALGYQLYGHTPSKKRLGCLAVAILLIARLAVHLYTLSEIITDKMQRDHSLNDKTLFVSQTFAGNILVVILFIGIIASIYGALGMQFSLKQLSYPYMFWIVLFTVLPLILIIFRAFFAKTNGGYTFTTDGFKYLIDGPTINTKFYGAKVHMQIYFSTFLRSLDYAVWTTVGCLIIGYPLAYILAERTKRAHKSSSRLLLLFVLPMWMNTMLRTYAWRAFLSDTGVLNNFLTKIGATSSPIHFLDSGSVTIDVVIKMVMISDFLPFMILPIYSVMVKIDSSLSQAAADLGANRVQTFSRVNLPLSLPGVISGIQMVFMPSMTFYMIPDIIDPSNITVGKQIETFILGESPKLQQAGNVMALILLVFVIITMGVLRNQDKEAGSGGMAL